ncbi:MAG TPA: ATP-binding protein [Puia sp.]|nr:ATP-binding protein [Puia sp.]
MREHGIADLSGPAGDIREYEADRQTLSKKELEVELADARLLHRLSIELIQEDGTAGLYKKIVEAAVAIMRSQYASMQMLYPDPGSIGKLRLLASSGFSPEAEKFWEWVYRHTGSSCGAALRAQQRVVVANFETCEFMQSAPTLPIFLGAGIFAAQSTPLYSRSGKLLGMISTHWNYPHNPPKRLLDLLDILARQAADLIERTQNAEALRKSQEANKLLLTRLEAMVDERTKELQRSNEDLLQFAHVASHDLKEPVRKIRTFGLRLQNELAGTLSPEARLYTQKILESAGRMLTMIDGVLTYSTLDRTEQLIELLDLNQIVADIANVLEVPIQRKGAVIECDPLPVVEGVRVLLYQVFYNLINNSLKFSKESGSPRITIKAVIVDIDGVPHSEITLTDNGVGFDPKYNESIFETFTRLHSKSKYDGTGLGLSLSKKVVERHKGNIRAEGIDGVGATFIITLPLQQVVQSSAGLSGDAADGQPLNQDRKKDDYISDHQEKAAVHRCGE